MLLPSGSIALVVSLEEAKMNPSSPKVLKNSSGFTVLNTLEWFRFFKPKNQKLNPKISFNRNPHFGFFKKNYRCGAFWPTNSWYSQMVFQKIANSQLKGPPLFVQFLAFLTLYFWFLAILIDAKVSYWFWSTKFTY